MQNLIPDLLNSDTAPLPYTNASLTSHSQKSCKYHSKRELLLLQLNSRTIATMYYQHLPGNPTFCKRISTSLAHSQDTNPPENSLEKKNPTSDSFPFPATQPAVRKGNNGLWGTQHPGQRVCREKKEWTAAAVHAPSKHCHATRPEGQMHC